MTVDATDSATFDKAVDVENNLTVDAKNATFTGTVEAGDITIDATTAEFKDTVKSDSDLTVTATEAATFDKAVQAGNNIYVNGTTTTFSDTVDAGSNITIIAADTLTFDGDVTAGLSRSRGLPPQQAI